MRWESRFQAEERADARPRGQSKAAGLEEGVEVWCSGSAEREGPPEAELAWV